MLPLPLPRLERPLLLLPLPSFLPCPVCSSTVQYAHLGHTKPYHITPHYIASCVNADLSLDWSDLGFMFSLKSDGCLLQRMILPFHFKPIPFHSLPFLSSAIILTFYSNSLLHLLSPVPLFSSLLFIPCSLITLLLNPSLFPLPPTLPVPIPIPFLYLLFC